MGASSRIRAVDALAHDGLRLARGEVGVVSTAAAKDLEALGLVVIVGAADDDEKTEGQRAAERDDVAAAATKERAKLPAAEANEAARDADPRAPATRAIDSSAAASPKGRALRLRG